MGTSRGGPIPVAPFVPILNTVQRREITMRTGSFDEGRAGDAEPDPVGGRGPEQSPQAPPTLPSETDHWLIKVNTGLDAITTKLGTIHGELDAITTKLRTIHGELGGLTDHAKNTSSMLDKLRDWVSSLLGDKKTKSEELKKLRRGNEDLLQDKEIVPLSAGSRGYSE